MDRRQTGQGQDETGMRQMVRRVERGQWAGVVVAVAVVVGSDSGDSGGHLEEL